MRSSSTKETVAITISKEKIEEFRKIRDTLKTYTTGANLTLSGITEEAVTKVIEIFKPLLNDLEKGKQIDQSTIYKLMSVFFSQVSDEFQNLKKWGYYYDWYN